VLRDGLAQVRQHARVQHPNFLDGAGAEGDSDVGEAPQRVQLEVELAAGAAQAAEVHGPPPIAAVCMVCAKLLAGALVDDHFHALAAGGFQDVFVPAGLRRVECQIGAELGQARTPRGMAGCADHLARAQQARDLQPIRPTPELAPWINTCRRA